jgi:hypothetical protein
LDNPAFAWLIIILAVVIVAAYFYVKRRQANGGMWTPSRDRSDRPRP